MGAKGDEAVIDHVNWKTDLPRKSEAKFFSIICGNTHLHWALHNGAVDNFVPVLFWRTSPVDPSERDGEPCAALSRHLPTQVNELVFGSSETNDKKSAMSVSATRKVAALTVYVISSNPEQESAINFLFRDVASRRFKLRNVDFFTKEQGMYDTMGADRAAALYAASMAYPKVPVMVIDAGTAMTYTALGKDGKVLGGGISPGIGARFRSMSDYTGALPMIDHEQFQRFLKKASDDNEPLPVFAGDTKTGMISAVFSEVANQLRYLIKNFLQEVKKDSGDADTSNNNMDVDATSKEPLLPTVVVTGGDSIFFEKLIRENHSGLVKVEPGSSIPSNEFKLSNDKFLIQYGIAKILDKKVKEGGPPSPDELLRESLINLRIAKKFAIADIDGDSIYRGTICDLRRGTSLDNDLFHVRYDDGDAEHLELREIHEALLLYHEEGEKATADPRKWTEEVKLQRKEGAKKAASDLIENSPKLVKDIEEAKRLQEEAKAYTLSGNVSDSKKRANSVAPKSPSSAKKAKKSGDSSSKRGRPPAKDKKTMYLNKRVAKKFPIEQEDGTMSETIYFGTVDKLSQQANPILWHVMYDDDDEEEFDEQDIINGLRLYDKNKNSDPKVKSMVIQAETVGTASSVPREAAPKEAPAAPAPSQPAPVAAVAADTQPPPPAAPVATDGGKEAPAAAPPAAATDSAPAAPAASAPAAPSANPTQQ